MIQFPVKVAAEVKDFDIEEYIRRKEARKMDRFTHYALAASIMAMKDANLELEGELSASYRCLDWIRHRWNGNT